MISPVSEYVRNKRTAGSEYCVIASILEGVPRGSDIRYTVKPSYSDFIREKRLSRKLKI